MIDLKVTNTNRQHLQNFPELSRTFQIFPVLNFPKLTNNMASNKAHKSPAFDILKNGGNWEAELPLTDMPRKQRAQVYSFLFDKNDANVRYLIKQVKRKARYKGRLTIRAYDQRDEQVNYRNPEECRIIVISSDDEEVTRVAAGELQKDFDWLTDQKTSSRPFKVVGVPPSKVGLVIGTRFQTLNSLENKDRMSGLTISYEEGLNGFLVRGNDTSSILRTENRIREIVSSQKPKKGKKAVTKKTDTTTHSGNVGFAALMSDEESDEESE